MFFYHPKNPTTNRRPTLVPQQLQVGQLDSRITAQIAEVLARSPPFHPESTRKSDGRRRSRPISDEISDEQIFAAAVHRASLAGVAYDGTEAILVPPPPPPPNLPQQIAIGRANNNLIFNNNLPGIPTQSSSSSHKPPPHIYYADVTSPQDSLFSLTESRRQSRANIHPRALILRRPTISIHEDGRILIDHVTARWDGVPLTSQSGLLDADEGGTIITDTLKEEERKEPKSCKQQTFKVILL
uniref:Uncharacterized protein n=1 Tax=Panagrolaimus sp. PS1159 TaxID=55785 RepID=A0AC35GRL0_9BILA